ncbi:MAG TPA: hypothetical protein ENI20_19715 [Bacteroides sp.]|nr:hypothetical protein [Bacteroides sp.]
MITKRKLYFLFFTIFIIFTGCEKEKVDENWIISNYSESFKNIEFSETLIQNFSPGIYLEEDIPDDLKQLTFGRIEIDFKYNGGALTSFMPILYYGSINKNDDDNAVEETQFHLVVEIGHYNVIPYPVENLFYTICSHRYPLYCRDTYIPVISGESYTLVLDKRPEGIILQLKKGTEIINSFPSAFFPDSSQLFFKDVTQQIDKNKGDSLKTILMIGKGFVGFDKGLHDFNGQVSGVKIYKYTLSESSTGYEMINVKNQHFENQQVNYSIKDYLYGEGNYINMKYDYWPYIYENGILKPDGNIQSSESKRILNNQSLIHQITSENIGLYKLYLETINEDNQILNSTDKPFEIWVYPKEWEFDY